ncbi:hypothetical protein ABIB99_002035 [Bradyrhizobium sp. LA6.1]|uniref:hypothetical protein n=1 Tax=Bradyrhizobium sp. LA6.1 TaxID=3156378 RepID=UPI003390EABB
MVGGVSPPDPFTLYDTNSLNAIQTTGGYRITSGRSVRSSAINSGIKNLVLLTAGQSLITNVGPTLYVPTNGGVIDNLNVYDGQLYDCAGPLLGTSYTPSQSPPLGPGNVVLRVADALITNGRFDRVIIVPLAIGNTNISSWGDSGGIHANRTQVAMRRLAARGITPGTTGVTFADLMANGHRDFADGTSQAAWTASYNSYQSTLRATGYNGRSFVCSESASGQTSNAIRSAQAAVRNGTTVCDGGDIDSSSIALSDGTHPSDAGSATMTTIIYNAMHASGAPY